MVALPFCTFLLSPGDEVVKHASPGIFNTLYFLHICILKEVYEVPACLDTFLGADSLQSPSTRVLMLGLYDLSKKRKVVACVTIYKQSSVRRAESYRNKASFSQPMMHHL